MINKGIGARIKDLREKLGLTQTDLAQAMKTTKQTVYKYENNIITNIPSDKIEVLSNVLQTNPAYLMGWEVPVEQINKHPGEMGYGYAQEIKRQNEDALKENEQIQALIPMDELEACFDFDSLLSNVDMIFYRVGL